MTMKNRGRSVLLHYNQPQTPLHSGGEKECEENERQRERKRARTEERKLNKREGIECLLVSAKWGYR